MRTNNGLNLSLTITFVAFRPIVAETMTQACQFFKSHGHGVSLVLVVTLQQLVTVLTGDNSEASAKLEAEMSTEPKNPRVLNIL
jgi:hypothetical protein